VEESAGRGVLSPDAVSADPSHDSVEFENDVGRVLRITYGPGERSVTHRHPDNCSITLGPTSWRMTDAEGVSCENSGSLGEVGCGDGDVHLPRNSGSERNEVVLVEFKGRETFDQ